MLTEEQKEEVIELRKQGIGFKTIDKILGLKSEQSKSFGKSKYFKDSFPELTGFIKQQGDKLTDEIINKRIESKYPQFNYVDGYINCESTIRIKCKLCGEIKKSNAQILRKIKIIECAGCIAIKHKEDKIKKIEERERRNEEKIKAKEEKKRELIKKRIIECVECGCLFVTSNGKKICSKVCVNKRENRYREISRSKLYKNGKVDYDLSLIRLAKKYKNVCAICGTKVNFKDFIYREDVFIAGENYPSIDHIKPKSKGGTHTWDNTQLAHRRCNRIKRDRDTYIGVGGQVVMSL
jgi:hypothetical protein